MMSPLSPPSLAYNGNASCKDWLSAAPYLNSTQWIQARSKRLPRKPYAWHGSKAYEDQRLRLFSLPMWRKLPRARASRPIRRCSSTMRKWLRASHRPITGDRKKPLIYFRTRTTIHTNKTQKHGNIHARLIFLHLLLERSILWLIDQWERS